MFRYKKEESNGNEIEILIDLSQIEMLKKHVEKLQGSLHYKAELYFKSGHLHLLHFETDKAKADEFYKAFDDCRD